MADTGLLVVVDNSEASDRAVEYTAQFAGRRKGFHVDLVHLLPALPAELAEHGGAEDPAKETRLETDLAAQQREWISAAKRAGEQSLEKAVPVLRHAGIPKNAIRTLFCEVGEQEDAADAILSTAREHHCQTIILGREAASWFRKLFSKELSEELLRRGKGFSIWVVE